MTNDEVCTAKVPAETLLEAKGERMEFKLIPASWVEGDDAGHIAIRCRRVTTYDREFMAHMKSKGGSFLSAMSKQTDFLNINQGFAQLMKTAGGESAAKTMLQKRTKKGKPNSVAACYRAILLLFLNSLARTVACSSCRERHNQGKSKLVSYLAPRYLICLSRALVTVSCSSLSRPSSKDRNGIHVGEGNSCGSHEGVSKVA